MKQQLFVYCEDLSTEAKLEACWNRMDRLSAEIDLLKRILNKEDS